MAHDEHKNLPNADRTHYEKTTWINDDTKLNESNMNHIEQGIKNNSDLATENAVYLDEIDQAIAKTNISFDSSTNLLTLSIGEEATAAEPTRYFYKKTLEIKPSHTFASDDEIRDLFL